MEASRVSRQDSQAREVGILDVALVLVENARILILVPFIAALVALGVGFLVPPTYTAITRVLPPAQQQSPSSVLASQMGVLASALGGAAGIKNPADQYVALLRSHRVSDAIIHKYGLKARYGTQYMEDARRELERRTRITAGTRDGIIVIEVEDQSPQGAANIANSFVNELRKLTESLAITEAAQRRAFFEHQLANTKDQLAKAEVALRGSAINEATLRTVPQSALEALARLKAQITLQEIKLTSMRAFMTDSNPEYKLALQELSGLRAALEKTEEGSSSKVHGDGADYVSRYRSFKYHETLFELMAKQYELARLDEAREGAGIQVVDLAQPPERQSGPRKTVIVLLAVFVTLLVTVLFVFVLHSVRTIAPDSAAGANLRRLRQLLGIRQV